MPITDVAPGQTRMYMSQGEVAERIGLSRNGVGRLLNQGHFATPDVWIARYLKGWDEQRVVEFAQAAEILDADGQRRIDPKTGKPVNPTDGARTRSEALHKLVSEHYSTPPTMYLGTALIAACYQQAPAAVYITRGRSRFIPADIVISTRFGWDEQRIIEFGHQAGKFKTDDRVAEWALERTTQYHLPAADWATEEVLKQGGNAPAQLAAALKSAGHAVPRKVTQAAKKTPTD
ncbi:helix-turn-helix domain-containing protein [Streptomyces albidoflavus]|uniref:helix-turn-helix domain-containing protein n=1 Tax=Streptomyces albidoflavus TaxID=1886 RepID=UPI00101FBDB0|nr:helix-turn-helix transcriptional regulator [Streptomyces albidoflavus]RZF02935.1 hypothetical protein C0R05_32515 [Streptomyces albidoflavus]